MIKIEEETISDLKALAAQAPGPYMRLVKWLDNNFHELNDALNHLDPSPDDVNFNERFNYRRGFVASLDTLRNFLSDPGGSLPEEALKTEVPETNEF
jgi:hypothetical protein